MEALGYSTLFDASGSYLPTSLGVGADGTAYVAGYGNVGLPTSDHAFSGGASDGFVPIVAQ